MSELFDDFKKYRNKHGLNALYSKDGEGEVDQNGALFTMEYLLCLLSYIYDANGKVNKEYFQEAQEEIQRIKGVFASLENKPGLSVRYPGSAEYDSMDNDNALLTFSLLFGKNEFAQRRRDHGRNVDCKGIDQTQDPEDNNKYFNLARIVSTFQLASFFKPKHFWNNQSPELFCETGWYGKSPGHMGLVDVAATGKTTWFRGISLWVGQMFSLFAKKGSTDSWKLSYLTWYFLKERGWIWRVGYSIWKHYLFKMYPNGMNDVYSIYYQDPNHPIRKWSKESF